MKKRLFLSLLLVGMAFAAWAEVAVITSINDKVEVERTTDRGKWKRPNLLLKLYVEDRIRIGDKGKATLLFIKDKHLESLISDTSPYIATATSTGCVGVPEELHIRTAPPSVDIDPIIPRLEEAEFVRHGGIILRGSYSEEGYVMPLVNFLGIKMATLFPTFWWPSIPEVNEYRFILLEKGDQGIWEKIWEKKTSLNKIDYPEEAPSLKMGKRYIFRVQALRENEMETEAWATFEVLSEEKITQTKEAEKGFKKMIEENPDDSTPYLLLAETYRNNGLLDEAIDQYLDVIILNPDDPEIHQRLSHLYRQKGLLAEAEHEARLAERLRTK